MNIPTQDTGIRPNGSADKCFYCGAPAGGHTDDCVLLERAIVVELSVTVIVRRPRNWGSDMVEFHLNESSFCADNLIEDLFIRDSLGDDFDGPCWCGNVHAQFIRDASPEDVLRYSKDRELRSVASQVGCA